LKLVGRIARSALEGGAFVRMTYPPFDILVAEGEAGEVMAIEDACNHAGASLSEGIRLGNNVVCPMHGYVFDLRTGALLRPRRLCEDQRRFLAKVEGDEVAVYDPFEVVVLGLGGQGGGSSSTK
jgi:nitrite reductase/ring-hydroxylating ferredoxin subunit